MTQSLPIEDGQDEGRALAADAAPGHSAEPEPCGLGPDGRVSHSAGHAPGPWQLRVEGLYLRVVHGEHKTTVANSIVSEANARLIAAAPLLLEVAERILDRGYVSKYIKEEREDHEALVAAISSARGGQ